MSYHFYGCNDSGHVHAVNDDFPGIITPCDLYRSLLQVWCEYTCTPRLRHEWTADNPTLGQCAITSFLAQDIFGGKVYGVPIEAGNFHCYNIVDDYAFDLTSEQFDGETLNYSGNPEQLRETHFQRTEKKERYKYLRAKLKELCA